MAVTVRPKPRSLASTELPLRVVLTAVPLLSFTATGLTVSVTVAVDVCPLASVVVYVNESGPEYPATGVYVYEPVAAMVRLPCVAAEWAVTVRLVPRSLPSTVPASAAPAGVTPISPVATGVTVMETVAVEV